MDNIYVTGEFDTDIVFGNNTLISAGSTDIFVAKLNSKCKWVWAYSTGDTGFDIGHDLAIDCDQNVVVGGTFITSASFGSIDLTNAHANSNFFLGKIDSCSKGVIGFLQDDAADGAIVEVIFPGGIVSSQIFNSLVPGCLYYIDCRCELSNCCWCATEFVGVACDPQRIIMGVNDPCTRRK